MNHKHTFSVVSLLSAICSFQVSAEVQHASGAGFVIENVQTSSASPEQTWQALTQNVDKWWPKDHSWWRGTFSIDAAAGGCFCEHAGNKSAEHMRVSLVDPNTTLVMTGGLGPLQGMGVYGALTWKLLPSEEGTTVTLTYRVQGYAPPDGFTGFAPVVDKVQALQLHSLITYLSDNPGD